MEKLNKIVSNLNENLPMIKDFPQWKLSLFKNDGKEMIELSNDWLGSMVLEYTHEVVNNQIVTKIEYFCDGYDYAQTKEEIQELEEVKEFVKEELAK